MTLQKCVATLCLPLLGKSATQFNSLVLCDIHYKLLVIHIRLICLVFTELHVSGGLIGLRCTSFSLQATPLLIKNHDLTTWFHRDA